MEYEKKEQVFPMNAVRLCVDKYGADMQGRIYSRMSEEPLIFANCSEMLLKADALFDERGYPQTFQEKRSFQERESCPGKYAVPEPLLSSEELRSQKGIYYTLDIIVWSRRRAGWQGMILYEDGSRAARFQSELELLECISRELELKKDIQSNSSKMVDI